MFRFLRNSADVSLDATELAIAELVRRSSKASVIDQLAVVEACAGMYSRCFAGAAVTGDGANFFPPRTLAAIARACVLDGNGVGVSDGQSLFLAGTWTLAGKALDRADWIYTLSLTVPSSTLSSKVPEREVFHVPWNADNKHPFRGRSAITIAAATAQAAGLLENAAISEAGVSVTRLIPWAGRATPDQQKEVSRLFDEMRKTDSRFVILPSGNPAQGTARPSSETVHPDPSPTHVELRSRAGRDLAAALGVPEAILYAGEGAARRAAMSAFIESSLVPLARLIEAEAAAKVQPIKIDFSALLGSAGLQARARAFKSLIDAGMKQAEAHAICF